MRVVFGIVSLVIVLLIVSSLVKKQTEVISTPASAPILKQPASGNVREQSQQIQQQIKQGVEAQMQARPLPDDSK